MSYVDCIRDYIAKRDYASPIYSKDLSSALAETFQLDQKKADSAAAVAIKRIIDKKEMPDLRCYKKGVYYRTAETPFAEMGIDKEKLIADKYILPDIGYESGLSLLHKVGITSSIPNERLIVSNVVKRCMKYDAELDVTVRPPKITIDGDNRFYFQFLDTIEYLDKAAVDADDPYATLLKIIRQNKLQYEILFFFADHYYSHKTILLLAHIVGLFAA